VSQEQKIDMNDAASRRNYFSWSEVVTTNIDRRARSLIEK